MRIHSGWLNERITIQSLESMSDAIGQPIETWSTFVETWASVNDVSGREYMAADSIQNSLLTKILIRYRAGVVATMRVLHRGNAYQIEAVLGQDRVALMLMCKRLVV